MPSAHHKRLAAPAAEGHLDEPWIVVGGGFTGLAAAYELARSGRRVTILEADEHLGGLVAGFLLEGKVLERFYHHWFGGDLEMMELIAQLGLDGNVVWQTTRTGLYYNGTPFRLTSPLDVLRFTPLGLGDHIRLGRLVLRARAISDWRSLEHRTARSHRQCRGFARGSVPVGQPAFPFERVYLIALAIAVTVAAGALLARQVATPDR
jgi:hypothetical protein